MWLRLTYVDETTHEEMPIALNTANIKRIASRRDTVNVERRKQALIVFVDGETIVVKESYTKVDAMLSKSLKGREPIGAGIIGGD